MRRFVELGVAAAIGALLSLSVVAVLTREPAPSVPREEWIDSEQALQMCRAHGVDQAGDDAALRAAFDTTAGDYADWMLEGPPEEPKSLNSFIEEELAVGRSMPIFVCYFDRDEGYYPSVPPGYEGPPMNRIRVLVDKDGGSFSDTIGSQGDADHPGMKIRRPDTGHH
ncbi:MAG: hypothetical protein KY395_03045 [Actinobacteria bacterium]|nr:hypothetical protein [Actinomycetota bacterium]